MVQSFCINADVSVVNKAVGVPDVGGGGVDLEEVALEATAKT